MWCNVIGIPFSRFRDFRRAGGLAAGIASETPCHSAREAISISLGLSLSGTIDDASPRAW
jgi:hypothetical protein